VPAVPELWSQTVRVAWKPSLRFYERRVPFMLGLEERYTLMAFKVEHDLAGARFGPHEMVEVTPRGAAIRVVGPKAETTRLREVLNSAIATFADGNAWTSFVALQYLDPLEGEYTDACARLATTHLGSVLEDAFDLAVLTTGAPPDGKASYTVEYGAVDHEEAPHRIARQVGRIGDLSKDLVGDVPRDLEFPSVALFSDWVWVDESAPSREVIAFWDDVLVRSEAKVEQLRRMANERGGYHQGGVKAKQ
jgi:hypothetical protein